MTTRIEMPDIPEENNSNADSNKREEFITKITKKLFATLREEDIKNNRSFLDAMIRFNDVK